MNISTEVIADLDTPIGRMLLRRQTQPGGYDPVTEIMVDDGVLMSTLSTASEVALATRALAWHGGGNGLRVLVGGLGLGYTARAALADPRVTEVRVVDRLPQVIDWLRDGLLPLSDELNAESRLAIDCGDVYAELLAAPDRPPYDLVLIDVDHSPLRLLDLSSSPFYEWFGQDRVVAHLRPGGVLGVWSADDDDTFADVLDEMYPETRREYVHWRDERVDNGEEIEEVVFLARVATAAADVSAPID
jgi:spermidine synthase